MAGINQFSFPVERALAPIQKIGKGFILVSLVLIPIILWGAYGYYVQLTEGLRVTGLNRPVYWGVYMADFVFFAGISQAGTLMSAMLRVSRAEWRRPLTRAAEVITLLAVAFAAIAVVADMGRPDRLMFVIQHARVQSPILWDITYHNLYLFAAAIYLYVPLIPDCAILRDRKIGWTWLYRILALGYSGSPKQKHWMSVWVKISAILIIPIAFSVQTVEAFIFATTLQPGWHSTIFGPLFIVGALYSGVAALILVIAAVRKGFKLENIIKESHFKNLAIVLLILACLMIYFTFNIYLVEITGNEPSMIVSTMAKITGPYALHFWFLIIGGMIFPAVLLSFRKGRTVTGCVIAAIPVLFSLWLERYLIVVPTLMFPRMPWTAGVYDPTWVEWAVSAGFLAAFVWSYMLFTKFFPIISLWEVQEGIDHAIPDATHELQVHMPDITPESAADTGTPATELSPSTNAAAGENTPPSSALSAT